MDREQIQKMTKEKMEQNRVSFEQLYKGQNNVNNSEQGPCTHTRRQFCNFLILN